ncbi:probable 50S ribosomal protein L28 at N-terminal half [Coccomyxa sp. Obi]|nr:probable 50S ribosomal protein L28 at N-terminal half [Coccomyxa sp. Obi]
MSGSLVRSLVKRSRRGLYAGKTVLSGNNVSEDGGNRTRRIWRPNVQSKAIYSEALDRMVRLNVTTAAMRTIDKYGGLDAYLLETPDEKLASDVGSKLKEQIRAALVKQKQQGQTSGPSQASSSTATEAPSRSTKASQGGDAGELSNIESSQSTAAEVPKRVRPDLVEDTVQKIRWDGRATQAVKRIYRRPVWTYEP